MRVKWVGKKKIGSKKPGDVMIAQRYQEAKQLMFIFEGAVTTATMMTIS